MSKRVNISVPDTLFQKMQNFKGRLNISNICQDAINRAVMVEEVRDQTMDDIDKLAIDFRKERRGYFKETILEGFKDGASDGLACDFQTMFQVDVHRDANLKTLFEMGAQLETQNRFEKRVLEEELNEPIPYTRFEDVRDLYLEGWLNGFLDVWERVSKKMSQQDP